MKRLVIYLMAVLLSTPAIAQNIRVNPDVDVDVDIDPDIDIDLDGIVRAATKGINGRVTIGHSGNFDKSKYQQDEKELEIPLSNPGERGSIRVLSHNGSVTVNGYNGQTIKLKMIKYTKKVNRESRNGMRLISSGGFNVEAQEYNNQVKIENEGWNNRIDFVVQVPKNFDVKAETYNNGKLVVTNINGEIDAENYNGPITLEGISGVASASTYNGNVKVVFNEVTADRPMAFSTYNGNVDLTFPASVKATAKMRTNRDIFTDFENFELDEFAPNKTSDRQGRGTRIKYENWTQGKINGGGAEVSMKTSNGNIYIRKGN